MAKVKVLFLASNPLNQSRLTLDEEIRAITAQIRSAEHRDALELVSGWAVRPDDLQQLLLQHKPQIVHFSGHGTGDAISSVTPSSSVTSGRDMTVSRVGNVGQLVLIGEGGHAQPMTKEALAHLFGVLRDDVRLVLLNACRSEVIAETLAEVIPCAIGMSGAITDAAAIAFATAFYRGLGFGRNIEEAFALGKNALMNLQIPEDQTPRLFTRKGAVAPTQVVLVEPSITTTRRVTARADRNRSAMIEKVRTIWITGFLQQSLFHETRILLGLSELPDAVVRPMDLLVKRPDEGERPLPSGTQIVDVFDTMDRSLLILGAPGSGKTTLLLELARDLLFRATNDPSHPIPVVFPLSTWVYYREKHLAEWIHYELNLRYDIPPTIAQEWVDTDQILPLLDGLDELRPEYRAECVTAINRFRQSHGFLPIAVTCRTEDYELVSESLRLHGCILVQPLIRAQVNAYLADLGPNGEQFRAAIHDDPSLWDVLDNPLRLNIVTLAYARRKEEPLKTNDSLVVRRKHIFGYYVEKMLGRRAAQSHVNSEHAIRWLRFLARKMADYSQTVFYLEQLDIHWLRPRQERGFDLSSSGLIGLVAGMFLVPFLSLVFGLELGLLFGLAGGLIVGVAHGRPISRDDAASVPWNFPDRPQTHSPFGASRARSSPQHIRAVCKLLLLLVLLCIGTALWNAGEPRVGPGTGLTVMLMFWAVGELAFALLTLLPESLISGSATVHASPNQSIRRSARNAAMFGLYAVIIIMLVVSPVLRPAVALSAGLIVGLVIAMRTGGAACLKHYVLRLWLIYNGSTPWNYVRFLDYAADRILLRKVGGGYMFIHRMLLEHFAARSVNPSVERADSTERSGID